MPPPQPPLGNTCLSPQRPCPVRWDVTRQIQPAVRLLHSRLPCRSLARIQASSRSPSRPCRVGTGRRNGHRQRPTITTETIGADTMITTTTEDIKNHHRHSNSLGRSCRGSQALIAAWIPRGGSSARAQRYMSLKDTPAQMARERAMMATVRERLVGGCGSSATRVRFHSL